MKQITLVLTAFRMGRFAVFAVAIWALGAVGTQAADATRETLESLRGRNQFDVAVAQIERLRNDPKAPEETKKILDYELGVTLLASAKAGGNAATQEKAIAGAKTALEQFLEQSPQHPLVADAKCRLGSVLVEWGRLNLDRAAMHTFSTDERIAATEQARAFYREAKDLFVALEAASTEDLGKLPKVIAQSDHRLLQTQQAAVRRLLESRMAEAAVTYEMARTYPPGSEDYRAALEASAKKYHECYEKHNPLLGSLYARLWEGRSYRDLGQYDQAMTIFAEIAGQPDEPAAIRELKNKAVVLALETALLPQVNRYVEGAAMYRAWNASAKPTETHTNDAMAIRFLGGKATLEAARSIRGEETINQRTANIRLAADALRLASETPGPFQTQARKELQSPEFAAEEPSHAEAATTEPSDYATAKDRAVAALARMEEAARCKERAAAGGEPRAAANTDREYVQARDDSLRLFRIAYDRAPRDTRTDDLNAIRYYLCYLYWTTGQLEEAAVMGEFLARYYPSAGGAKPAARIAMAAWAKMATGRSTAETALANGRLVALAELAAKQWPGEPEADQAWMMLGASLIQNHDVDKATEAIAKIPETSRVRMEAELMAGQALWGEYLSATRQPEQARPQRAHLDRLLADSKNFLEQGVARIKADDKALTYDSLNAVAETLVGLGDLASEGSPTNPQATSYFRKAAESYRTILSRISDPQFGASKGAATRVKVRLARCLRSLGDYREAVALLLGVLKDHPNLIDAQCEASSTLQAWGQNKPNHLLFAIGGGKSYKEVWGWEQIARRLQTEPRAEDIFHEASYNSVLCRYLMAESLSGEQRDAVLKQAEAAIDAVEKLRPDMGGKNWHDRYHELLKSIQQSRAKKTTGLRGMPADKDGSPTTNGERTT